MLLCYPLFDKRGQHTVQSRTPCSFVALNQDDPQIFRGGSLKFLANHIRRRPFCIGERNDMWRSAAEPGSLRFNRTRWRMRHGYQLVADRGKKARPGETLSLRLSGSPLPASLAP